MAISRLEGCSPLIDFPLMDMSPDVIGSRPAMVLRSVDLPQPDGPTRTRKPPSSISMLISFRIGTLPYDLCRSLIWRNDIELSLHGAGHEAADEIASGDDVDDESWQRSENGASEMH